MKVCSSATTPMATAIVQPNQLLLLLAVPDSHATKYLSITGCAIFPIDCVYKHNVVMPSREQHRASVIKRLQYMSCVLLAIVCEKYCYCK
jgi:hypothetical protein